MAFAVEQLARVGQVTADNGTVISQYFHATTALPAVIAAAGYFDLARSKLKVGDMIDVSAGLGATPATCIYRVTAVPAAPANVTVVGGTITTT